MKSLPHGPLMIDVAGLELTDAERERLLHPLIGGVILFKHNYRDPQQLPQITQVAAPWARLVDGGLRESPRELNHLEWKAGR